jgi:hypothetical protein
MRRITALQNWHKFSQLLFFGSQVSHLSKNGPAVRARPQWTVDGRPKCDWPFARRDAQFPHCRCPPTGIARMDPGRGHRLAVGHVESVDAPDKFG